LATCIGCTPAPTPSATTIPPPPQPIEHVQSPSKLDVQREMNYRELKAALDNARKALNHYDDLSESGP
ncbi:MAG TPA: hypothetical protein VGR45_10340, partial [Stellaceae bacterium]|nr:hypothetical protein [Stellaceae bacterium]